MKLRHKATIATAALTIVGSAGGIAVANISGGTPDTGSGLNEVSVPQGYSGINDPNLQKCMATQTVCNPAALPELQGLPWTSPLPAGSTIMSRTQAEQYARVAIGAATDAPTFSELMTGDAAIKQLGVDRLATTNESRPVWIVTVRAPVTTDGGPAVAPQVKQFYSAVVDAGSGQITDDCVGCAWLSASR
jgi:hypothetical protein